MLNLFGFVMHVYVHSEDKFEVSFYNCCLCLVDLLTGRGFILMSILYDNHPSHFVIYAWSADNFNCEVAHDATCQLSHLSSEVGKNT